MPRTIQKTTRNLLFGLGVFAALGFGGATAWAQPGTIQNRVICPFARDRDACINCCADGGQIGDWNGSSCNCI